MPEIGAHEPGGTPGAGQGAAGRSEVPAGWRSRATATARSRRTAATGRARTASASTTPATMAPTIWPTIAALTVGSNDAVALPPDDQDVQHACWRPRPAPGTNESSSEDQQRRGDEVRRRSPTAPCRHAPARHHHGTASDDLAARSRAWVTRCRRGRPRWRTSRRSGRRRDELVVGAELDDAAVVDDGDAVGAHGGGQAVGDDDGGAAFEQHVEGPLDLAPPSGGRGSTSPRRAPARGAGRGTPARGRAAGARPTTATSPARARGCRGRRAAGRRGRRGRRAARPRRPRRRWRSGRAKARLSRIVPWNRNGSCGTTPSWRRSDSMRDVAQVVAVDAAPGPRSGRRTG